MLVIWVILGLLVLIAAFVIMIYNRLITLRTHCEEAWSDIDVQMKRRYDLIPNLVESVKGYMQHERTVFENVTAARSNAINAQGMESKAQAENQLSQTLKTLFAVAENYPDLKANQNFLQLQTELRDAEDKIAYSRRFYNTNVRDLNIAVQTFPSNIIANMYKFSKKDMFELTEATARTVPQVKF
ncbi:MAG: LemA family protein [Candidatus Margulisiibacteriota bacterium]